MSLGLFGKINLESAYERTRQVRQKLNGGVLPARQMAALVTTGCAPITFSGGEVVGTTLLLLAAKDFSEHYQVSLQAVNREGLIGFFDFSIYPFKVAIANEAHNWLNHYFQPEALKEYSALCPISPNLLRLTVGVDGDYQAAFWVSPAVRNASVKKDTLPPLSVNLVSSAVMIVAGLGLGINSLVLENVGGGYQWEHNKGFTNGRERLRDHYIKYFGARVENEVLRKLKIDIK